MTAYTPASVEAVRRALRQVLGTSGPGGARRPLLDHAVSGPAFVAAARRHRVVVLLAGHLDELGLDPTTAAALRAEARSERVATLGMVRALHGVHETLAAADVDVLSLKGVALAALAHGDFAARGSGDLDVLVRPADAGRAHAALVGAGWVADPGYPVPGDTWAWRHTVRNYCEVPLTRADGLMVDLHWHPMPARDALPPFDVLWERRALVPVGPAEVATLGLVDSLAHAASHAGRDDWGYLRSLVDVVLLDREVDRRGQQAYHTAAGRRTVLLARDLLVTGGASSSPRDRRRALLSQASPADDSFGRFPGYRTVAGLRRSSRDAVSPADVRRIVMTTLAHPGDLGGVTSTTSSHAVAQLVRHRGRSFSRRFRQWGAGR